MQIWYSSTPFYATQLYIWTNRHNHPFKARHVACLPSSRSTPSAMPAEKHSGNGNAPASKSTERCLSYFFPSSLHLFSHSYRCPNLSHLRL
ncbi:hypothetical protein EYC80_008099 [Monilinia laxa]|uniref:Uncharacterized protein n=1 Tax=Monilinia laxa TaxID=61186 RepID=A0A5N6JVH8_MONLA|nr:hypothetical protein EYC80_008099 [Monilinia laxa]